MPPDRYRVRRLVDKILVAFHHACDLQDHEIAAQMLMAVEMLTTRRPVDLVDHPDDRRGQDRVSLIAAHQRLWHLRHRELP